MDTVEILMMNKVSDMNKKDSEDSDDKDQQITTDPSF